MMPSNANNPESEHGDDTVKADAQTAADAPHHVFESQSTRPPDVVHGNSDLDSHGVDEVPLFERARTQWQLGEWSQLVRLVRGSIESHPERARLASFAAVAHWQLGDQANGRKYASLAREWGCSKDLLGRLLISGAHNNLAIAKLKIGERDQALQHFQQSIAIVTPRADTYALARARLVRETAALGHLPDAAEFLDHESQRLQRSGMLDNANLRIFETQLELLRHELSLAQRRGQLGSGEGRGPQDSISPDHDPSSEDLERHSQSQLGQDVWVLEQTGFKRNGFFVEFGATDGVALSNTWLLENYFGWDGICAEPNPKFYRQLVQNRACTVADACIAGSSGREVEFILAAEFGGIADYAKVDMHADKRSAYKERGHFTTMTTISLNDFLEMHNAPRVIDYMSVDTEGNELDILESFPFDKWQINYLTIEHNYTALRPKLRTLLEANGFRCLEKDWDDWYEYVRG